MPDVVRRAGYVLHGRDFLPFSCRAVFTPLAAPDMLRRIAAALRVPVSFNHPDCKGAFVAVGGQCIGLLLRATLTAPRFCG